MLYSRSLELILLIARHLQSLSNTLLFTHPQSSGNHHLSGLCYREFSFFRLHVAVISYRSCLSLPDTSFSIMSSRFIHVAEMARLPSFSWLHNIPLHVFMYVSHVFFIQSSIEGCLGCFHILALVNHLFEIMFSFIVDKYSKWDFWIIQQFSF